MPQVSKLHVAMKSPTNIERATLWYWHVSKCYLTDYDNITVEQAIDYLNYASSVARASRLNKVAKALLDEIVYNSGHKEEHFTEPGKESTDGNAHA
jgi:hypothetical protein